MTQIFFHAGLHKTGTTYLQRHVFPHIEGGTYISGKDGFPDVLRKLAESTPPILCSVEALSGRPQLFEHYESARVSTLNYVSSLWPNAGLILFLREPSELIVSTYVHYLSEAKIRGTEEFGAWFKRLESAFCLDRLLGQIDEMRWARLLLFDYSQLRQEPEKVISTMGNFIGCTFPGWQNDQIKQENISVRRDGARFLRWINRRRRERYFGYVIRKLEWLRFSPRSSVQQGFLYWLNHRGEPLVPETTIESLREKYTPSWECVLKRVAANHESLVH